MTIDNIVNVQISRDTAAVTQAGFGSGNFLSNDARFSGRIAEYGSVDEINADDLVGADSKLFASKYFGQEVKPTKLFITKKANDVKAVYDLIFAADFVSGNTIDLDINSVGVAQTTFTTDQATTMAALIANLLLHADVEAATLEDTKTVRVTSDTFGLDLLFENIVVAAGASQTTGSDTLVEAADTVDTDVNSLIEAQQTNDDWYALAVYTRVKADIELLAAYIQPLLKIFIAVSADADCISTATTDVGTALKNAAYDRTALMYSTDQANFPEGGWLGRCLPLDAGSITWKFKTLAGVTIDSLTSAEKSNALGKNINTYTEVGGVNITENGTVASGEFLDVMRGLDWVQARIKENVFSALANEDKIPFTNDGINVVVSKTKEVLDRAVTRTILTNDPQPAVTAPLVSEVPTNDRANRHLPDVKFTGVLAGAIHSTKINGNVSV